MKKILFIFIGLITIAGCKKKGCRDKDAINYNAATNITSDPASCEYLFETINSTIAFQSGSVSQPTIWDNISGVDVDYYVNSIINIESELTIAPGVVVEFGPSGGLVIKDGKLLALGDSTNRIILRNATDSDWLGVMVNINNYIGRELQLSNVNIIKASGFINNPGSLILDDYCNTKLNNVVISGSDNIGLSIKNLDNPLPQNFISNLTISNCEDPLVALDLNFQEYSEQITLLSNTNHRYKYPQSSYSSFTGVFSANNPHYFSHSGNKYIEELNAEPGTEFLINNSTLTVSGDVSCNGTALNPIVFKGENDDYWQGIKLTFTNSLEFNYVNIQNIYNSNTSQAPIYVTGFNSSSSLLFTNCNLEATNVDCGIRFQSNNVTVSQIDITGSTFIGCDNDACY